MPRYYFHIAHGHLAGTSDVALELNNVDEAWKEMIRVCGDLIGGACRALQQNSDWHMELLDEARKPLLRIRLVTESLA